MRPINASAMPLMPDSLPIRPAVAADAGAIAHLMRHGMSPTVSRMTILGSPQLAHWVAGQLAEAAGDAFLVAEGEWHVVGMVSSRRVGTTLVLNHLYTDAAFQRRGVARTLLAGAVAGSEAERVAVDVFTESQVARRWYGALGFAPEYRRMWLEMPLPRVLASGSWSTTGMAEAELAQADQGFSFFKLHTEAGEYVVGRLMDALFRSVGFGILGDAVALGALAGLDAQRSLLCIGAPEDLPAEALEHGRLVTESERLSVPRADLAVALPVAP